MSEYVTCRLCKHEWIPRTVGVPLACPRCKRYDWRQAEPDLKEEKKKESIQ